MMAKFELEIKIKISCLYVSKARTYQKADAFFLFFSTTDNRLLATYKLTFQLIFAFCQWVASTNFSANLANSQVNLESTDLATTILCTSLVPSYISVTLASRK